ncbi:MAG: hypothetical protein ACE5IW_12365 [bacterium]
MMLTIELSSAKVRQLDERAKRLGVSAEEFAGKLIEFIVDTTDEDFEGWIETLEILSDKEFTTKLKESIKQAEEGKLTDWNKAKSKLGFE